jgi:hypothetical protein
MGGVFILGLRMSHLMLERYYFTESYGDAPFISVARDPSHRPGVKAGWNEPILGQGWRQVDTMGEGRTQDTKHLDRANALNFLVTALMLVSTPPGPERNGGIPLIVHPKQAESSQESLVPSRMWLVDSIHSR